MVRAAARRRSSASGAGGPMKKRKRMLEEDEEPVVDDLEDFEEEEEEDDDDDDSDIEEEPEDDDSDDDWDGKPKAKRARKNKICHPDSPESLTESLSDLVRDFLASIGITTATQMLAMGSTDMSKAYADYRKSIGMEPLKGSGKTATISGWKALVRKRCNIPSPATPALMASAQKDKKKKSKKSKKKKKKNKNKSTRTKKYTTVWEALPPTCVDFLQHLDIKENDYDTFQEMKSSDLATAYTEYRKANDMPELKGSGAGATVSGWKTIARNAKARLERRAAGLESESEPEVGDDSDDSDDSDSDDDSSTGGRSRSSRRSSRSSASKNKAFRKIRQLLMYTPKNPDAASSKPKAPPKKYDDPFQALVPSAREFLESIGMTDPDTFINIQTNEVAVQYVPWREAQGLPPLKGSGPGATISAWKTAVRKASKNYVEPEVKPRTVEDDIKDLDKLLARVKQVQDYAESIMTDDEE